MELQPRTSRRRPFRLRSLFSRFERAPAPEEAHRIYAVGDVHGRADLLDTLMSQIMRDAASAPNGCSLVFVGDYIDRGPDSRGVVDRMLHLPRRFETFCLRGNHEQALLDFLEDPTTYRAWRRYGADETLLSYDVQPPGETDASVAYARDDLAEKLPPSHLQFMQDLQFSVEIGAYHFVHAGVRPGVALEDQSAQDMLWIRDEFLNSEEDFGKVIVHGHTPTDRPVCRSNRIGIDTRAFDSGCLTAVVLDGAGARFLST